MRYFRGRVTPLVALCALIIAACGPSTRSATAPTPAPLPPTTAPSPAEPTAQLTIRIDSLGSSVAVTSLSQVEFDARGSTGTTPLQYALDFGDQTSSTDPLVRHRYQTPGTYQAAVTVTDAAGKMRTASQAVTVRSLVGSWYAAGVNRVRGHVEVRRLTLASQNGVTVAGDFQEFGHAPTRVTGSLEDERSLRLNVPGEPAISANIASPVAGDGAVMELRGFGATDGPLVFQPAAGGASANPPIARLDLQIDGSGSTGAIYKYSPIRFSAIRSAGDSLSHFIEFGDGTYGSGGTAVHPCERLGLLTARVVVVDRFGGASEVTQQYPCFSLVHQQGVIYSLAYGWVNRIQNAHNRREEFRRIGFESQDGAAVSGFYWHPEGNRSHFHGSLTGDRGLRLVLDDGTIEFTGEVRINDVIGPGGMSYLEERHLLLNTRGSSADGIPLDFTFYDPF